MPDVVRALAISAGLLLPVVVFIIFISMVAVRRGEAGGHSVHAEAAHEVPAPAVATPAKAGKAAVAAGDEISVSAILLIGLGLFTVTIGLLLIVSLIQHL